MKRLSASTHVSIGVTLLTLSLIFAAEGLGLIPSTSQATISGRKQLCESLAIQCSLAAQDANVTVVENTAKAIVERNRDILSVGLRTADGPLLMHIGDHTKNWAGADSTRSTPTHV